MKITDDDITKWEEEHVKGKKARHMDETLPGFFVNETAAGDFAYYFRMRDSTGRRYEKQIAKCGEMTVGKARNYARSLMPQVKVNGLAAIKKIETSKSLTGQQLYEKWLEWAKKHPNLKDAQRPRLIDWWGAMSQYHNLKVGEISKKQIEDEFQHFYDAKLKSATINRYLTEMKFLIRWGEEEGLLEKGKNHWSEVKHLAESDSIVKIDHFTEEERTAIRKAALERSKEIYFGRKIAYIYPLVETLWRTGLRPGTTLGLIWADYDAKKERLRIRANNIKTKNNVILPISDKLCEILNKWRIETEYKDEDQPIFTSDGKHLKSMKKQMKHIFERAEAILGKSLHFKPTAYSFRHDHASEILRRGGNITDVQHALTHASPRMSTKYAHPSEDRMRKISDLFDE